jgi:hypothetical protein
MILLGIELAAAGCEIGGAAVAGGEQEEPDLGEVA